MANGVRRLGQELVRVIRRVGGCSRRGGCRLRGCMQGRPAGAINRSTIDLLDWPYNYGQIGR